MSKRKVERSLVVKLCGLAFAIVCVGVCVAHFVSSAMAAEIINYPTTYYTKFYDSSGNEIIASRAEGDMDSIPPYWYDSQGRWYHCVEPFSESYKSSDAKDSYDAIDYYVNYCSPRLSRTQAERLVQRFGYAHKWAEDNYSGDYMGLVEQLVMWEIMFDEGLIGLNYGSGSYYPESLNTAYMITDYGGGVYINSDTMYNNFMTWYNSLSGHAPGAGVIMKPSQNQPTQKVGRFWVVPSGYAKVTKKTSM